ncbi:sigma-54 interaction domain-containing protein [Polyangium mundeleinium]|uniref:Sigma-54 dependent transcriptional regulator n=1 Tax=Polyangium mundeleinium TaxID=2995306 RepID=A0ABT5ETX8_9BACT|nr:sigma-54 dependent transcriptional regulator [Polyangium mundeleinium]MDC0744909.1 sigma-54 dependent transcriptional regulator [Polyangium mundeleinium]
MHQVKRALLTWSDAGVTGRTPSHHAPRPSSDRGPVLRLLDQDESRYEVAWVLTIPEGEAPARSLCRSIEARIGKVELVVVPVTDPSDYGMLFRALGPLVGRAKSELLASNVALDVLLSAGTPQAQTLWVILVQAGLLPARMLQVIPPAFVPVPHPKAVREVRLDIEGFPEIRAMRDELARLRAAAQKGASLLLGESAPMVELRAKLDRVGASDAPVLVLGETGTGKELCAREIHALSPRKEGPFVAENCSVFAEGVLSSELFGHEAGAFTGAGKRRRGVFEQAHGGTLFLDEIGEMQPRVQAALLRVLQEGTLRRVGGEGKVDVDVRIVAATHRDLGAMVKAGAFREDLYYRLRGATLLVPPLRARPGDVELLVESFLAEIRGKKGGRRLRVTREAMRALASHVWPGNVRELRAEVMRWAVFCDDVVNVSDLAPEIRSGGGSGSGSEGGGGRGNGSEVRSLRDVVEAAERAALVAALAAEGGNLSRAARALGIDRNTLKRKMRAFGMAEDDEA